MPDILHRVGVQGSAATVFEALVVKWQCVGGPDEWIGNNLTFRGD